MPLSILFWVLMVLWFVLGLWIGYVPNQPYQFRAVAGNFLLFLLFCILGWKVFGPPVQ